MAAQAWGPTVPCGAAIAGPATTASGARWTTVGWAVDWSDSPTTPVTEATRSAGTDGSRVPRRTVRPSARRARTRGTWKVASTWAAEPVAGTSRPPPAVAPTWSPVEANHVRAAVTVAGVGPKTESN